ncbi:hypothetical protein LCGC14_0503880 [marine sediment metagenome]|uniref:Uncharacterized protein n=1 Tax=marine sediment metagenome TaxID=412755 RepID=A0A0F9S3A1_9ZZZZ
MKDQLAHLSTKLRTLYPGRPTESESRTYKLLGIKKQAQIIEGQSKTRLVAPNKRGLPGAYVIFDPHDGSQKKIEYISDTVPTGPNAMKPLWEIPGNIEFRRQEMCEIKVDHNSWPLLKEVDIFLFFSPWLVNNKGKEFHLHHKFGYLYTLQDHKTAARLSNEELKDINIVHASILDMEKEEVAIVYMALKFGDPAKISPEEVQNAVLKHYGDPKNTKAFRVLTENNEIKFRALIKKAEKYKFIEVDSSGQQWIWTKGGEAICNKYPGKTVEESLLVFFTTSEGNEAAGILYKLVTQYQEDKNKKGTTKTDGKIPDEEPS